MSSDDTVLRQFLSSYKHADFTRREISNVIQQYKCLAYRLEAFIFNNGSRKDLINLAGTIPVNYKGSLYNIPVCVWIMDTHPNNAPLCFVKPTADMSIKVSKYVDSNGKVYLPYLHQWNASTSSLLGLIQCMISAFGELPPVYSKPRTDNRQAPYPVNSFMPQPGNYQMPMTMPGDGYPGANPPYPTSSNLPYPSYGTGYPGYPPPGGGAPFPPSSGGSPYPGAYPPAATTNNTAGGTITEEHIKASLLSAVEDKLKRRLREQSLQSQAELETLRRTQQELNDGKTRLEEILQRLQKEQSELDKNITVLQEKEKELERSIEKLSEHEGIDVDQAVVTTAPLYNQLLDSFAEEAALEDAIYYVGEALRKEVIDLDTFLKQVRTLSRRQFTLRALMQKCRQKARLAC